MKDKIISYREMCDAENAQTLQRGMNYRLNPQYSVILMSQRRNAPYTDKISNDGLSIEYEGHDVPRAAGIDNPKTLNQPKHTSSGRPTQNGLFTIAVDDYKAGKHEPEIVRVYEKIHSGIWSEKGFFKLTDYKYLAVKGRNVFRFVLEETEIDIQHSQLKENRLRPRSKIIPSEIKRVVWERDKGRCVMCGAADELHFDHDLPYSKGGASISIDNVKILCARHNLSKSDKIE